MSLASSKTIDNLKAAFAGESQANRRYLYFAQKADVEGYNDVAAVFRSTAEGETGHAHGHLEFMEGVGDPATGLPIGGTSDNLKAAIAGETHEYTDMYPGMARTAQAEGHLRPDAAPALIGMAMTQLASGVFGHWAHEMITEEELEAETAYGFAALLTAYASPAAKERLETRLRALEKTLCKGRG